jgi:3,4-dihydroxy 2-butanone 4-phosphate synthase/GTP cyclohydrolase II
VAGRVALPVTPTPENLRYLIAKRDRLGHQLDGLPAPPAAAADGAAGAAGAPDGRAPRAGAGERG